MNAVTQLDCESQLAGVVSPVWAHLIEQLFTHGDTFTGRDWRIRGEPAPAEPVRPKGYYGSLLGVLRPGHPRQRILLREALQLTYPYRTATRTGIPELRVPLLGRVPGTGVPPLEGPQGDDSLLWSPRPTRYRDPETRRSIMRDVRRERRRSTGERLLDELVPIARPRGTSGPQVVAREREKEAAERARRRRRSGRRRRRRSTDAYGFGAGTSGGRRRATVSDLYGF